MTDNHHPLLKINICASITTFCRTSCAGGSYCVGDDVRDGADASTGYCVGDSDGSCSGAEEVGL